MKVRTKLTKFYCGTLSRCILERPQSSMPKRKSHASNRRSIFLEKEILALERKLEENNPLEPHKEIVQTELRIKKQQLEEIISYKTQGAIIRSKVKWYNEGERSTKYFHSLEKRHLNSKTIRNLVTDDGTTIFTGM